MNRKLSILALLLFLVSAGTAHARIKIVEKPGVVYDSWTSSWGLRLNQPNEYPMGTATHKTKAEAVAAANRHMAKTAGGGDWAVTHYLIEGVPSTRGKQAEKPVKQAGDLLTRLKQAKDDVDHARKVKKGEASLIEVKQRQLGDVVREFGENIERALGRIEETKKTLTRGVASQTDAQFRKVNGLIDEYNRKTWDFQNVMGSRPSFRHNGRVVIGRTLKHLPEEEASSDAPTPQPQGEVEETDTDESVAGTEWTYVGGTSTYKFLPDGTFSYENGKHSRNGTWSQNGHSVTISGNLHAAHVVGSVMEIPLRYDGHNRYEKKQLTSSEYVQRGNISLERGDASHDRSSFGEGGDLSWEKDFEDAISEFSKAIRVDPTNSAAYHGRGKARSLDDSDKAMADFNEAIRLDPSNADAYARRGSEWLEKHEYDYAIADLDESIRLDSKMPLAYCIRSIAYATCTDPNFRDGNQAVKDATRACELDGWNDWKYVEWLAAAYAERGDFDEAIKWQIKAIELAPKGFKRPARMKLYKSGKPFRIRPSS